ncbi:MAG: hypothetical protein ACFBSC_08750 [Microcoleaceae cyanobacterium]
MFFTSRIKVFRDLGACCSKQKTAITYETTVFPTADIEKIVQTLKTDGLSCGLNLPDDLLLEILKFSKYTRYLGNANPHFPFFLDEKVKAEAQYQCRFVSAHSLNPAQHCLAVQMLENDATLWKIAADYLGTQPVLVESRIRWIFAIGGVVDEPLRGIFKFHYDLEDYRFIKFIFYLTDVDRRSCPHACIRGSHQHKKLSHQFSLLRERTDQEMIDYYGKDRIKAIYGPAGFGFVEDFYCFHKATLPVYRDRLILETKFAMNRY